MTTTQTEKQHHDDIAIDQTDLTSWLNIPDGRAIHLMEALDPKARMWDYWEENTRPDGRMFEQARTTKVVKSLLKHSAGSVVVKQGETKIMSAMTIQIGQPNPQYPDHGDVLVTVTSPDHCRRLDSLQSWLQRMLDDLLPRRLNLITGKYCIRLVVMVMILQDGGNLKDASLLACMAAWKHTRLPTMAQFKEVDGKLWWAKNPLDGGQNKTYDDRSKNNNDLPTAQAKEEYRISLSIGIIRSEEGGQTKFLVDPAADEVPFLAGMLTMVVNLPDHSKLQMEYSGSISLGTADLTLAAKLAEARAQELSRLLIP